MPDRVFPQENDGGETRDDITEEALATTYAALVGFQSTVANGLSLNPDYVNNEVDISEGTAVIMASDRAYIVSPIDRVGLDLDTGSGVNHIFLTTNLDADDDISIHIDTDDTPPSTPSVKLGTVDTEVNEATNLNRSSGGGGIDITEFGNTILSGATAIEAGSNITASDSGDETATLDASFDRVGVRNDGTSVKDRPDYIDFLGNLSVSGTDDNGVEVSASGGSDGTGGYTDSGSLALEAAGNDTNNNYDLPVYVPDGQSVTINEVGLSLADGTTDTNVKVKLLDSAGTSAGSISLDSHPKYSASPGVSYSNTSGSLERVLITVINEGGTDYIPSSGAADYVQFALQWSVA